MSVTEVKKLRKERSWRVFSINFDKLENSFIEEEKDPLVIEEMFARSRDISEGLFKIDDVIKDLLFSSENKEDISQEFDKMEEYCYKWISLCTMTDRFSMKLNENKSESNYGSAADVNHIHKHGLKLFRLEPKKFDGNLKEWIGFWAMFRRIHDDENIEPEVKFHYLLQLTVESSPPRELLESFPPSSKNYYKAVEQLKSRFGRDDLLILMYVRELLKLVLLRATGDEDLSLRKLYDRLETYLRALESLGVTSDKFALMLHPLVESSLPIDILKEWDRERSSNKEEDGSTELENLLKFVRREVESEERCVLAKDFFTDKTEETKKSVIRKKKGSTKRVPTVTELCNMKSVEKDTCVFCSGQHNSESCFKARKLSPKQIQAAVKSKGCCYLCLRRGNNKRQCRAVLSCIICEGRHAPLMCPDRICKAKNTIPEKDKNEERNGITVDQSPTNTNHTTVNMQTLRVIMRGATDFTARVLIDSGSQRSYVTRRVVSHLGYKPIGEERLVHALFGGTETGLRSHQCYKVRLTSTINNYTCNFVALEAEIICQTVPVAARGSWLEELEQKGIELSDKGDGPIHILIGADIAGKLMTGKREVLQNGLVAMETLLGWTLMGKVRAKEMNFLNINMLITGFSEADLWRLDVIGTEDPEERKTREQLTLDTNKHFQETVKILENGRYEVRLPWIEGHPPLPTNLEVAKKRLETNFKKLQTKNSVRDYENVVMEWLKEEVIEEIFPKNLNEVHYLPHRPVFKENSTTRVRPVFDALARSKGQPSLNQCLAKGINLIELIPTIILHMRLNAIAVPADVKKAFLQIAVHKDDRNVLRSLWPDNKGGYRIFRHKRVVFGVCSSPFLLGAVFEHHLNRCEELINEGELSYSIEVIKKLRKGFYVDNCVASVADKEELEIFIDEAKKIFAMAKFELRGWEWTDPLLQDSFETNLLGMLWDRKKGVLKLVITEHDLLDISQFKRRSLLSATQKVFDVIGVSSPTMLIPKLLIQKTWLNKGNWDTEVDEDVRTSLSFG